MKTVVSVSLGSSKRDHSVNAEFLGTPFRIERKGTDGDLNKAIAKIEELDGKVDAIGLGGIDLYLYAGNKRYLVKDAQKLARKAVKTPVVDGSNLKNTLERKVINYLMDDQKFDFSNKTILMVCGVDRFGMAQTLVGCGANVTFGDLVFGLGIPLPLKSLNSLERTARIIAPLVCKLPFKFLYPTGSKQDVTSSKHNNLYKKFDVIAGDFHYIKRYMPDELLNKIIITNTVTEDDVCEMKKRGIKTLVTTTPELNGRSFGTNVMEGVLLALSQKDPNKITAEDYSVLLDKIGFVPRVQHLN